MSIFLSVLLLILKIIGIVLLSILGLLLFVLIIVLFVPIRYKAKLDVVNKDVKLIATGSWLLHLVLVSYSLDNNNQFLIKIFGHTIDFNKEKRQKKSVDKKDTKKSNTKKSKKEEIHKDSEQMVSDSNATIPTDKEINADLIAANEASDGASLKETNYKNLSTAKESEIKSKEVSKSDEDILEELLNDDLDMEDEAAKKDNKTTEKYGKIKNKLEVIKSDSFKQAFSLCKKELIHLFKIILPKKWYIDARVGFDDPSTTGKILAATGMLYGLIHKHVNVVGDFENEIVDIHGKFVGHITAFKLLCVAAHLYFNKNLKSIINQFREA